MSSASIELGKWHRHPWAKNTNKTTRLPIKTIASVYLPHCSRFTLVVWCCLCFCCSGSFGRWNLSRRLQLIHRYPLPRSTWYTTRGSGGGARFELKDSPPLWSGSILNNPCSCYSFTTRPCNRADCLMFSFIERLIRVRSLLKERGQKPDLNGIVQTCPDSMCRNLHRNTMRYLGDIRHE